MVPLVTLLTTIMATAGWSSANAPPKPTRADSVEAYLAAFEATYELPPAEHDALALAQRARQEAERWWVPSLSLRETLENAGGVPTLDLSLSARTAVFDATADPSLAAAAAEVHMRAVVAAGARSEATAAFLNDVFAYAVLWPASEVATAAVSTAASATRASHVTFDPAELPPGQRARYEEAVGAASASRWLRGAVHDVRERLAHRLSVPVGSLAPPAYADVTGFLAAVLGPDLWRPRSPASTAPLTDTFGVEEENRITICLEHAPALEVARARHAVTAAGTRAEQALDVLVEVVAGIDASLPLAAGAPTSSTSKTNASIGLEARFVLPETWPLAGTIGAAADLSGVSQTAELTWPPRSPLTLHSPDPDGVLASEVAAATWEARALIRAVEQAGSERASRHRELVWAIRDAFPELAPASAVRLAVDPFGPAWQQAGLDLDPELARLRVESAVALLGELSAALDLAGHCGALPQGSGGRGP